MISCNLPSPECAGPSEASVTAISGVYNGGQDLMSDPVRPWVYSADKDGDTVRVLNASTKAEMWNISVGSSPSSMDLTEDGRYLYVAVLEDELIAVVDLETRAVSKTIDLDYSPISLRIGLSGRLYISYIDTSDMSRGLAVIDETNGHVLDDLEDSFSLRTGVLEMSPNKTVLLMMRPNSWPLPLYKFSCGGDRLVLIDQDYRTIEIDATQIVVDWENETIYAAAGGWCEVTVISLATLDLVASYDVRFAVYGIALSPDRSIMYCSSYNSYAMPDGVMIYAFNASDCAVITTYKWSMAAMALDDPSCLDDMVDWTTITAPSYAGPMVALGRPVIFVDLSEPALAPEIPGDGELVYSYFIGSAVVGTIEAGVFLGIPARDLTLAQLCLDGDVYEATVVYDDYLGQTLFCYTHDPEVSSGEHSVDASIAWEGGTASITWTFFAMGNAAIVSASPADDEVVHYIPEDVSVTLDMGYPEGVLTSCLASVNSHQAPYELEDGVLTIDTGDQTENFLLPGRNWALFTLTLEHYDYVRNTTYTSTLEMLWDFHITDVRSVASTEGLSWHSLPSGVSLMLPTGWEVEDEVDAGDSILDTLATGPDYDGIGSEITLQHGIDPSIKDNESLCQFATDRISDLSEDVGGADLIDRPSERDFNGFTASVFSIRHTDAPVVQKVAVIANLTSGSYWLITANVQVAHYFDLDPMFEGVIYSLTLSDYEGQENDGPPDTTLLLLTIIGAAAAAIAAVVIVFRLWDKRGAPPKG